MTDIKVLQQAVAALNSEGNFGKEGQVLDKSGIHLVDGDTLKTESSDTIRLQDIDTEEVPHFNPVTQRYEGGTAGGLIDTEVTKGFIENEGFVNPVIQQQDRWGPDWLTGTKDKQGFYGRDIGDLTNDKGQSLTKTLLAGGFVTPSAYASQDAQDTYTWGAIERAQREAAGEPNANDLLLQHVKDLRQSVAPEGGIFFKPLAPSQDCLLYTSDAADE